jgi:hypothetical protein
MTSYLTTALLGLQGLFVYFFHCLSEIVVFAFRARTRMDFSVMMLPVLYTAVTIYNSHTGCLF